MIDFTEMMNIVDTIRQKKKMSITSLCDDIISTRTYSRYLAGENIISIDILTKLLDRMGVQLNEFASFYNDEVERNNRVEVDIISNLLFLAPQSEILKSYKRALEVDKPKTVFANHTFPLAKILCEYLYEGKSKEEAHDEAVKLLNYELLIDHHLIIEEEVLSLSLFIYLANKEELTKIYNYFLDFVKDVNEYNAFFFHFDRCYLIICFTLFKIMNINKEIKRDNPDLVYLVNRTLDYLIISKQHVVDAYLLEVIYFIYHKFGIKDKYLVFNYISAVISDAQVNQARAHRFSITKDDIKTYYEVLNDREYLTNEMYDRVQRL